MLGVMIPNGRLKVMTVKKVELLKASYLRS